MLKSAIYNLKICNLLKFQESQSEKNPFFYTDFCKNPTPKFDGLPSLGYTNKQETEEKLNLGYQIFAARADYLEVP